MGLLACAVLNLSACGQKGALKLPPPQATASPTGAAANAASPAASHPDR